MEKLQLKHILEGEVTPYLLKVSNHRTFSVYNFYDLYLGRGTAVAQWLRYCATNQKVAGSIPDGVMEFFIDINHAD
jgi:hypothetical protein